MSVGSRMAVYNAQTILETVGVSIMDLEIAAWLPHAWQERCRQDRFCLTE